MDDVITKLGTISESLIRVEGKVDQIKETVSLHDAVLFGDQRDKQGGMVRSISEFEITVKSIWKMVRWAVAIMSLLFLMRLPAGVHDAVKIVAELFSGK